MSEDNAAELFQPVRMGGLTLPNRVVMAPRDLSAGDIIRAF